MSIGSALILKIKVTHLFYQVLSSLHTFSISFIAMSQSEKVSFLEGTISFTCPVMLYSFWVGKVILIVHGLGFCVVCFKGTGSLGTRCLVGSRPVSGLFVELPWVVRPVVVTAASSSSHVSVWPTGASGVWVC